MKISELKDRRIIRRATREFDQLGNRIYNSFEYDFPYDPTFKGNETQRLFAKLIDLLPFFLIFFMVLEKHALISLLLSIASVLILGTITEFYWGTTVGKKIFKIKVLDDNGSYPNILKSLKRNFLCLANFDPVFADETPKIGRQAKGLMNFSMHLNNKICCTYIVKESKIAEIKRLLSHKEI